MTPATRAAASGATGRSGLEKAARGDPARPFRLSGVGVAGQTRRSTIIFLISAIALAGLSPFGQVLAQFMIVWQR